MSETGVIFDVQRFALHDGPGIRTTVFFKGCPLHCGWCHNPESIYPRPELLFAADTCRQCGRCADVCPNNAVSMQTGKRVFLESSCVLSGECTVTCPTHALSLVGYKITDENLYEVLIRDRHFYRKSNGGVTLSGGEPLLQSRFALSILARIKNQGIHTCLDTTAHGEWKILQAYIPLVDLFLVDIKCMDNRRHQELTGVENTLILENIRELASHRAPIHIRVPVIPSVNDDAANMSAIAAFVRSLPFGATVIGGIDLLPYNPLARSKYRRFGLEYRYAELSSPSLKKMEAVAGVLAQSGVKVNILRGIGV